MFAKEKVDELLESYDKTKLSVATVCSHSSLQIFHGAKKEGLHTIGIAMKKPPKFYDAFPLAKPDEFLVVDNYKDIFSVADRLLEKNAILIPHGSFVEYLGPPNFEKLPLPTFGNRRVIAWESDRAKQRQWLTSAGLKMPSEIKSERDIKGPVMVKYSGAKGGRGFFIAKDQEEFNDLHPKPGYVIQEYIIGTRYYIHYFYSPIQHDGYKLSKGTLEVTGMDRRDESNIDELYKVGAREYLKKEGLYPSFVVTGNVPVVIRESLLPKAFEMGEKVVEESIKLFGGMTGPFCLETVVTDNLEYNVFEISARIVAGTNLFISGSPYSEMISQDMSTGRRIAMEIKNAVKFGKLAEIIS